MPMPTGPTKPLPVSSNHKHGSAQSLGALSVLPAEVLFLVVRRLATSLADLRNFLQTCRSAVRLVGPTLWKSIWYFDDQYPTAMYHRMTQTLWVRRDNVVRGVDYAAWVRDLDLLGLEDAEDGGAAFADSRHVAVLAQTVNVTRLALVPTSSALGLVCVGFVEGPDGKQTVLVPILRELVVYGMASAKSSYLGSYVLKLLQSSHRGNLAKLNLDLTRPDLIADWPQLAKLADAIRAGSRDRASLGSLSALEDLSLTAQTMVSWLVLLTIFCGTDPPVAPALRKLSLVGHVPAGADEELEIPPTDHVHLARTLHRLPLTSLQLAHFTVTAAMMDVWTATPSALWTDIEHLTLLFVECATHAVWQQWIALLPPTLVSLRVIGRIVDVQPDAMAPTQPVEAASIPGGSAMAVALPELWSAWVCVLGDLLDLKSAKLMDLVLQIPDVGPRATRSLAAFLRTLPQLQTVMLQLVGGGGTIAELTKAVARALPPSTRRLELRIPGWRMEVFGPENGNGNGDDEIEAVTQPSNTMDPGHMREQFRAPSTCA
ncbi:hypothetical protein AMAG_13626 [Allomyces macrogynus ATCC 38327]|uniref:Uncharacterized protein n=1 Tax=Allomyces macrogynus (strain ATCC 38327) TaxID=578462 RepID=A0A0L0T306_ALLM3|nr:hypothetical protein AMAG_13626 [Allomyces macrogynus ATCC 38327]|eukprot:KNE69243.1 hypothetical protein AMAG_13626 [Allomyces macrogynus ATCC 38327]